MTIKTINSHCVAVYNRVNSNYECTVFSYDTPVLKIDSENNMHRLWGGWSMTTQKDINKAVNIGMTKKIWDAMPIE